MNTYTANTLIALTGMFTQTANGNAIAPTSVICRITDPSGTVTDLSTSLTNPLTGIYTANYLASLVGIYTYEFIGTGSAQVSGLSQFFIAKATF